MDRPRAAADGRVGRSSPDENLGRSQFIGRVVLDEPRISDLDIRGLRRPQAENLDRSAGVVLERTVVDQAAVPAVLKVDAALVVTA